MLSTVACDVDRVAIAPDADALAAAIGATAFDAATLDATSVDTLALGPPNAIDITPASTIPTALTKLIRARSDTTFIDAHP